MPVNYQASDKQIQSLLLLLKILRKINVHIMISQNFHDMTLELNDLNALIQLYHLKISVLDLIPGLQYLSHTVTMYLFKRRRVLFDSRFYHYVYNPETKGYLPSDYFNQHDIQILMTNIIKLTKRALKLGDN